MLGSSEKNPIDWPIEFFFRGAAVPIVASGETKVWCPDLALLEVKGQQWRSLCSRSKKMELQLEMKRAEKGRGAPPK